MVIVKRDVRYPDSDGQPMSDNTLQFDWIGLLKWNAEAVFADRPDVFVAGDHLIYADQDDPTVRAAPDVYVVFGRPKGYRGSYLVWDEGGVFPQVVFEVWSPSNRQGHMEDKRAFYDRHGAEEYYIIYPEFPAYIEAMRRGPAGTLDRAAESFDFVSPRLGFRFTIQRGHLTVRGPDGRELLRPDLIARQRDAAEQARLAAEQARLAAELARGEAEQLRAEAERVRSEAEQARAEAERVRRAAERGRADAEARAERLAARLRDLGADPDAG